MASSFRFAAQKSEGIAIQINARTLEEFRAESGQRICCIQALGVLTFFRKGWVYKQRIHAYPVNVGVADLT
jgi:hypothetical protein